MKVIEKYLSNTLGNNRAHLMETFTLDVAALNNVEVVYHSISHNTLIFKIVLNEENDDPVVVKIHNFYLQHKIELQFSFEIGAWSLYVQKPYDQGVSLIIPVHNYWQAHRFTREYIRIDMFCGVFMEGDPHLHDSDSDSGYESANGNDGCLTSHQSILLELI